MPNGEFHGFVLSLIYNGRRKLKAAGGSEARWPKRVQMRSALGPRLWLVQNSCCCWWFPYSNQSQP
jgi:hypothetical protein